MRTEKVQRIDEALAASASISSNGASRKMSAVGRRRISMAQKARWAMLKAKGHAPKPKRTISAAGKKRIEAAQESAVGEGEAHRLVSGAIAAELLLHPFENSKSLSRELISGI